MSELIAEEAERLQRLYTATGDIRFHRAACVLRDVPMPSGPQPKFDDPHVTRMAWLLHKKEAANPWQAANMVADEIGGQSVKSTARRLYGKFRRNKEKYSDRTTLLIFEIEQAIKQSGLDKVIKKVSLATENLKATLDVETEKARSHEDLLAALRRLNDQDRSF